MGKFLSSRPRGRGQIRRNAAAKIRSETSKRDSQSDILQQKNKEIKQLTAELDKHRNQRISNSCVPCSAINGDCCGVIYWSDDGKFLCNECEREFNIDRWIPVAERLPEKNQYYLTTAANLSDTHVLWYRDGVWRLSEDNNRYNITKITHWKPIILPREQALEEVKE